MRKQGIRHVIAETHLPPNSLIQALGLRIADRARPLAVGRLAITTEWWLVMN